MRTLLKLGVLGAVALMTVPSVAAIADDTTAGPITIGEETSQSDLDEFLYVEWIWDNGDGTETWVVVLAKNDDRHGHAFDAISGTCTTGADECESTGEIGGALPDGALVVDAEAGLATLDLVQGDCTIEVEMAFTPSDRRPQTGTVPRSIGPAQGDAGPRLEVSHSGSRHVSYEGPATGSVCGWGGTGEPTESYAQASEHQQARRTTFVEIDTTS